MAEMLEKLKDDKVESILFFINAMISTAFRFAADEATNPLPLLVTSFFFLFLMFVLFTWNRRENRYLVIGSWSVYALLFYYWILA